MGQLLGPGFSFAIELIQCHRRATTVAIEEARRGPGRETELKVDSVSWFIHVSDESGKFGDERQKPHLQRAQILAFQ